MTASTTSPGLSVLYLHQHFVARSGTSGGRSYEFSRILLEKGHRITMVTGAYDRSGLELEGKRLVEGAIVDGIKVVAIKASYSQSMGTARRLLAFAEFMVLSTWAALRQPSPDVVFATSTPLTVCVPGILVAALRRRPFVFEVRDLWPAVPVDMGVIRNPILKRVARWLERLAYRRARVIVALSPGMKQGVVAAGVPEEKVRVIPNSSDVELFRVDPSVGQTFRDQHPELLGRPLVCYVGAFGRVNGLEYLLTLAQRAAARDSSVAFLLVGEGSEEQRLKELSQRMGLSGQTVFFHKPVPRAQLSSVLSAATVLSSFFIPLPIMETNSANKFFDALAAGKPVVINYGGWQAKLLEESGAGLVLPARDPDAAAERLVAALHDSAWLQAASAASRQLGDEVFNRRRLAKELETVFLEACGR